MAETRCTTRNQNYDVTWSNLNHDVFFLVMMRLGFVDFPAFSRVCKSWRSLALSNRKRFLATRPPMSMRISPPPMSMCFSPGADMKTCHLKDFEGRKFKTTIPHYVGTVRITLTCGYLILFGTYTHEFWLVNPITRHQLHFPRVPGALKRVRSIFVFFPSMSRWVFVIADKDNGKIWFSIAGTGIWNHVSSPFILNIHAFKGKLYTLNYSDLTRDEYQLYEVRLSSPSKLTLLETKNFPKPSKHPIFASSGENLYLVHYTSGDWFSFHELDFGEMKWVCREKTREEYVFFFHSKNILQACVFKQELWADLGLKYGRSARTKKSWKDRFSAAKTWYFPHDCMTVNLIHE